MGDKIFIGKAGVYHRFRPSYPREFIDYLYEEAGFGSSSVIADIGSGTGIFSRLLLERGSLVYAVEPNDDMRIIAERELGMKQGFCSINAAAEDTGLCENSVNFVTAAQAFHWFDRQKFAQECNRILSSGGKAAIVWSIRDFGHKIVEKDYALRKKFSVGDTSSLSSAEAPISDVKGFFAGEEFEDLTFPNDLYLKRDEYIGMNLTRSYSPTKEAEPKKYFSLITALGELFDEYDTNGVLSYPHVTRAYIGIVNTSSQAEAL